MPFEATQAAACLRFVLMGATVAVALMAVMAKNDGDAPRAIMHAIAAVLLTIAATCW